LKRGRAEARAPDERLSAVPADVEQWSEKSKQSVAYGFKREYQDIPYNCWHCKAACVFTAQDQRYTFEVKKASIDQRRTLCASCWSESHRIRLALRDCEERWARSKAQLSVDKEFLSRWSGLLVALEAYVAYRPDAAKKDMFAKLMARA
jgi:hypothetical protein